MKNKSILPLIISVLIPFLLKADWIPLNKKNSSQSAPKVTLISDDNYSTVLKIEITGFERNEFISGDKNFQIIDLLSESFTNTPGLPELPYIAKVLAIPDFSGVSVEVLEKGEIQTFKNINLPPARESWFEGAPETPFSENSDAYNSLSTFPSDMVQLETPSIFRDFRITRVSVYPVRYISAKKELQVVSSITVRINYGPGEVVNPKTSAKKPIAPSFGKLYQEFIFNYQSALNKSYGGKETGHELMLCIMPDEFVTSFQTYATWKRQSGIDVQITKFTDIGANSTNGNIIKNHITDAYHNWEVPPTYVLIVGDDGVFPKSLVTLDGWTFPNEDFFVEIDGNDFFPELMIGRLTNTGDVGMQTMINKFIKYEKTPYTASTDWFKKGTCCSNDAYPSQIETKRFAAERMLQYGGFTSVDTMMSNPGCTYNVANVVAAINSGRSWLNYRGEGWYDGWAATCTPMHTSNVTTLTNGQKNTFVTSIGCGVARFDDGSSNCFGEAWMEIGTPESPKGAIAFIGPTSNTHTAQNNQIDKGIYVGMFQEGLETPGQALLRGKLFMYNIFGTDPWVEYHYKIYCVLGDPSIHIWKDIPKAVTVNYTPTIPFGSNLVEFTVTHTDNGMPVANAVVCVTGTDIFATGITGADGKAYVDIFYEVQETLTVTVRGGNIIPFIGSLSVVQPTGPYVIRESYIINDIAGGNGNGQMDYSESILLSLTVKNVGTQQANNVNATLSTNDQYITFTDNYHSYGNIAAGQTITATNAFSFNVANNIPDQHNVVINVAATNGTSTWNSYFSVTGQAPVLSKGTFTISDPGGNNNGRLDPGETATLTFGVNNNGHSLSPAAIANLTCSSPYITINTGTSALGQIAAGNSVNAVFSVTCSPSTPIGQNIAIILNVTAGSYGFSSTFNTPIGLVLEDWELGNFTRFPWTFSGNANWAVVSAGQYEGNYTAISGSIEDNQTSSLSLTLQVNSAGQVSFYRKTSSEANYDYLRFYIDNVLQGQWAGETAWGQVSYAVSAGVHTFKWTYYKDYTVSSGSDCVWVDYIVFPPSTVLAPEISVNPTSFSKSVMPGGSANDVLNIANSGNVALDLTAQVVYPGTIYQTTVYPQAISYGTGTCTSTAKTFTSAVKAIPPSESGWMKFDVSSIPAGSTINSVEFHGYVAGNTNPYWSITPVSVDPVTANPSVLYPDINAEANNGFYLYRNETGTLPLGWITHMLEGNVNSNLESALSQGWFAIGFTVRNNNPNFIYFNGWNSGSSKPYLVINYSAPGSFNWLKINGGNSVTSSVAPGSNQNLNISFEAGAYPEGTYTANIKITSNDIDESQIMIPCTLVISSGMNVSIKVMIEGPFNISAMSTGINSILPLTQPYNVSPWIYNGTESVGSMPSNVVDWVLVELRDATSAANASSATRIARQAGLLLTNGNIVATDGISPLFFTNSVSNSLFVVVNHRNHLAILSANAVTQTGGVYTYDFTTSSGKAYGTNSQKELTDGYWGMWCGDANGNGIIGTDDLVPAWKNNAGKTGYFPADLNFNRQVNNPDKDNFWRPNIGMGTNVPQ